MISFATRHYTSPTSVAAHECGQENPLESHTINPEIQTIRAGVKAVKVCTSTAKVCEKIGMELPEVTNGTLFQGVAQSERKRHCRACRHFLRL